MQGETVEGLEDNLIQTSEVEEDPLGDRYEMNQESNMKSVKSKKDKHVIVKTMNNKKMKVMKPEFYLVRRNTD